MNIPNCALNIDVTLVLDREVRVVGDDVAIMDLDSTDSVLPTIVRAVINGVTLCIHRCSVLKWPRVFLRAPAFLVITRRSWVVGTTWPMNHDLLYYFEELWFCLGVWPVGADAGVNVGVGGELENIFEEDEEVHVWESALLEFDGVDLRDRSAKDAILHDVLEEGVLLQSKHASDEFRAIRGFLSR